jgi:hypothetical protein
MCEAARREDRLTLRGFAIAVPDPKPEPTRQNEESFVVPNVNVLRRARVLAGHRSLDQR